MPDTNDSHLSRRAVLGAAGAAVVACIAPPALAQQREQAQASGELLMRAIPSSGEKIPAVGLGTSRQFNQMGDAAAVEELKQTLQAFLDNGGRVVDTAPSYGEAEAVVGQLSTDMGINDQLWLATKVRIEGQAEGEQQMQSSFERLKREEPIQLMQVHNLVDVETQLKTMQAWKEQGKFRYIGVTHSRPNSVEELAEYAEGKKTGGIKLDFIQLPYNVELRSAEERLLPACKENGVATMINVPFGSGRVFRELGEKPLPDHAKEYADSWAQAMLKFILANEAVTVIIPGTSNPRHARDNCNAMRGRLPTADEIKRLIEAVEA